MASCGEGRGEEGRGGEGRGGEGRGGEDELPVIQRETNNTHLLSGVAEKLYSALSNRSILVYQNAKYI